MGLRGAKPIHNYDTVVNVARELFDAHGFQKTSMKMIAEKAGVPKSSIAQRFNKYSLFLKATENAG